MSRLTILMYHMVCKPETKEESRYAITPKNFANHMRFLVQSNYQVLSLSSIERLISDQKFFPERSVVITFDDGFADNYESAYPILGEYGLPATIFLISAKIGGVNEWMSGTKAYPVKPLLNWVQVHEMAKHNIEFGSHTVSHANLLEVSETQLRLELQDSKKELEDHFGMPVTQFAYPYGSYNQRCRDLVETVGYKLACTTRSGFNNEAVDALELRRLEVYGTDSVWQLRQKMNFGTNDPSWTLPFKYYGRRLRARLKGV